MFLQSFSCHPVNAIYIVLTDQPAISLIQFSSSSSLFPFPLSVPSSPLPSILPATPLFSAGKEKQQKLLMNKESKEKRADMRDQLKQKVGHMTSHDLSHDLYMVPLYKGLLAINQPHCVHIVYISHTEYTYSVCVLMLACVTLIIVFVY